MTKKNKSKKKPNTALVIAYAFILIITGRILFFININLAIAVIFTLSSIMLFINELSDFFRHQKINVSINVINWIGIISSVFWFIILVAIGTIRIG